MSATPADLAAGEPHDPSYEEGAEARRRGATALLGDLVRTPSLSGGEEAVIERLRDEMEGLGYDEVVVDPFGSVIGRIGDGPVRIVYDSHVDTVDVGSRGEWAQDPFEPTVRPDAGGGVMWGRGASDDKAGVASMVHGGALYKERGCSEDVTLYVVGSVQEEHCDGLALEHVLTEVLPRPDLVVLGEATGCDVYRGNRGRIEVLVQVRGTSCHASAPERGHNPVYDLAGVITEVQALNGRLGEDAFLGPGSVALTRIECETPSLNAVPSTASLYLDRRLTAGETPEAALEEIRRLPAVQAAGGRVELLTYERTSFTGKTLGMPKAYRTWVTPEDHAGVRAGLAAGERALGRRPSTGHWVFSTNGVASMGKLGIPTIGFGPGDEVHAHTVHDQCPLDDLVAAMAWYAAFPAVFAAAGPGRPQRGAGP
ncbi:MAG: YgeY family selenium metabolism-linked hydrolase [Acidimicrobiales bacterium]